MRWLGKLIGWLRALPPERLVLLGLVLLVLGVGWGWQTVRPRPLEVTIFPVGDGAACLLRAPGGRTVLIDGGSRTQADVGAQVLVPELRLCGVRKIDAIILTHPDSDHYNGIPAVLQAFPVGVILDPGLPDDSPSYLQVRAVAQARGVPWQAVRAGTRLALSRRAALQILAPGAELVTGTSSDANNNSLVVLLEYGASRLLCMGDAGLEEEAALRGCGDAARAQVLLVAHHGSRSGTGDAWLAQVTARIAVISCGGAQGIHPAPEVLARLERYGMTVYRTDVHGQIRLSTRGEGDWAVRTHLTVPAGAW